MFHGELLVFWYQVFFSILIITDTMNTWLVFALGKLVLEAKFIL